MATTCRDIIKDALGRIGMLAAGREPSASAADQALQYLNNLYTDLVGMGTFGRMRDVRVTAGTPYTAHEQERISIDNDDGITVSLPTSVTQEYDYDGPSAYPHDYGFSTAGDYGTLTTITERPVRDQSIVIVNSVCSCTAKIYVYDGATSTWHALGTLTLSDPAPLALRYRGSITSLLAEKLCDPYGQQVSPSLQRDVRNANVMLTLKPDRPRIQVVGSYF
jgi:hypothetical protein